jgi:hypothetical protein
MVQDWDDISEVGHALTYILQRVGSKKDGVAEVVAVGGEVPPNYGTPIGTTWFGLK